MRKILVTAIGGDVGHSILKCLTNSKAKLYGCDVIDYPVGGDLVDKYYKVELASNHDYIESIIKICKLNEITHLIPVSEPEIIAISNNRELFSKNKIKVLINTDRVLDICLDKYETCKFLNENGLNKMEFYLYDDFIENGKQYIAKLRRSCGSKVLKVFKEKKELIEILEDYNTDELIIQEYIDTADSEYTIGVFKCNEDIRTIIFNRKLQNGFTKFIRLSHDQNIKKLANEIAKLLDVEGSINIQLRKYKDELFVFEINPRLSGTTNFRKKLGFNDVYWWLQSIDGEDISSYEDKYESAVGIREMNEKIITSIKKY